MNESTNKVTPFLMFSEGLEDAIEFYTSTFPDSEVRNMSRNGKDGPVTSAEFVVGGQRFMGFNGGPHFKFSEAFSLFVNCENQAEVDRYWEALLAVGAKPTQSGWITDPWGVSWQIVPKRFMELMGDKDPKKVKAVIDAMMKMVKLDVAGLEAAYESA
jgi:predicted 3-demethylubiquinone-9 3-methyltransferase (glyoxalase superfamily)